MYKVLPDSLTGLHHLALAMAKTECQVVVEKRLAELGKILILDFSSREFNLLYTGGKRRTTVRYDPTTYCEDRYEPHERNKCNLSLRINLFRPLQQFPNSRTSIE